MNVTNEVLLQKIYEILSKRGHSVSSEQTYSGTSLEHNKTRSIAWLLMPWLLVAWGHQQPQLTMHDKYIPVFPEQEFGLPVPTQCWVLAEKCKYNFSCFLKYIQCKGQSSPTHQVCARGSWVALPHLSMVKSCAPLLPYNSAKPFIGTRDVPVTNWSRRDRISLLKE